MKYLLLYLTAFLISQNSFSQSTFQTSYGDVEIDFGNAITATTGNGYCVVSTNKNSTGTENADLVIYNIDDNGGLLWSAKIGTSKNDFPKDIIQTPDGGFAITGYTFGGLIDSTTSDVFLLKTDDQGFPYFFQTFGGPSNDVGNKILNSPDGGFYIAGSTQSFGNGLQSAFVLRADANGSQVWTNVNSAVDMNEYRSACFNSQGQIIAAGNTFSFSEFDYDNYISLIDTNGTLLWSKKFGSTSAENLNKIILANDGGLISVGSTHNITAGDYDINICKMDSAGTIQWNKNYGTSLYDEGRSISICPNGDLAITGSTNILNSSTPLYQTAILRLNSNGNLLWSNTYGDPSNNSEGASIINGLSNTLISIGYVTSVSDVNGETHFVKTDANGASGCYQQPLILQANIDQFNDSMGADAQSVFMTDFMLNPNWNSFSNQFSLYCFNNSVDKISSDISPIVYPNPGIGNFRIEIGQYANHQLEIFNSIGQKIMRQEFMNESVGIDLTSYPDGIYYFTLDNYKKGKINLITTK